MKPQAKRWPDEQKPHKRRASWMRRPYLRGPIPIRKLGRRCGGHEREGECAIPGEILQLDKLLARTTSVYGSSRWTYLVARSVVCSGCEQCE